MSLYKMVKLAKKFELKLKKEGQFSNVVRQMTGPGQYTDVDLSKVQVPQTETLPDVPPPPPEHSIVNVPETKIEGRVPNSNIRAVQTFLNQEFLKTRSHAPIDQDGLWGPETSGALKQWLKDNNSNLNLQNGFRAALTKARAK